MNIIRTHNMNTKTYNIMKTEKLTTDQIQQKIDKKYELIAHFDTEMEWFMKEGDEAGASQRIDTIILLQEQINKLEEQL